MPRNCINNKIRAGEGEIFKRLKLFDEPEPAENLAQKVIERQGFEDVEFLE